MREPVSAVYRANDDLEPGTRRQAQSEVKVFQLDQYRAAQLDKSVSLVRRRLSDLLRARVRAELSAGRMSTKPRRRAKSATIARWLTCDGNGLRVDWVR